MRVESENVRTGEIATPRPPTSRWSPLDDDGQPAPCRRCPETPDEMRRAREAQLRRDTPLAERERIRAARAADSSLLRRPAPGV